MNDIDLLNEIYYNDINQQPPEKRYRNVKEFIDDQIAPVIKSQARDKRQAEKIIMKITKVAEAAYKTSPDMFEHLLNDLKGGGLTLNDVLNMYNDLEKIKKHLRQ